MQKSPSRFKKTKRADSRRHTKQRHHSGQLRRRRPDIRAAVLLRGAKGQAGYLAGTLFPSSSLRIKSRPYNRTNRQMKGSSRTHTNKNRSGKTHGAAIIIASECLILLPRRNQSRDRRGRPHLKKESKTPLTSSLLSPYRKSPTSENSSTDQFLPATT